MTQDGDGRKGRRQYPRPWIAGRIGAPSTANGVGSCCPLGQRAEAHAPRVTYRVPRARVPARQTGSFKRRVPRAACQAPSLTPQVPNGCIVASAVVFSPLVEHAAHHLPPACPMQSSRGASQSKTGPTPVLNMCPAGQDRTGQDRNRGAQRRSGWKGEKKSRSMTSWSSRSATLPPPCLFTHGYHTSPRCSPPSSPPRTTSTGTGAAAALSTVPRCLPERGGTGGAPPHSGPRPVQVWVRVLRFSRRKRRRLMVTCPVLSSSTERTNERTNE
jgi:hypothetical protein